MKSLSVPAVTALIIAAIVSSSVLAQEAPPVRIRGTIEKVDGNTLMVKARDGSSVKVTFADNARVTAMVKAQLSDIKQGSFIGVTAMPQPDGSQKAIGLHIFMESQKGVVADRHFPWDREPGSTMTNANVESLVSSVDGQTIMVNAAHASDSAENAHREHDDRDQDLDDRESSFGLDLHCLTTLPNELTMIESV